MITAKAAREIAQTVNEEKVIDYLKELSIAIKNQAKEGYFSVKIRMSVALSAQNTETVLSRLKEAGYKASIEEGYYAEVSW